MVEHLITVWHFPLEVDQGPFTITVPRVHRFLTVGERQGRPTAWFMVDPTSEPLKLALYNLYTGVNPPVSAALTYLGTVRTGWKLVFHYFKEEI